MPAAAGRPPVKARAEVAPRQLAGARIVVVETQGAGTPCCSGMLEAVGGYRVSNFQAPEAALRFMELNGADLVLVDQQLDGMDGLELLRRARALQPGLPAILMSANASLEAVIEAIRERVDDFLLKPIAPADLIEKVRLALARAAAVPREHVLAIGAHPDDVEIGAGGTLIGHRLAGDAVTILTLTNGARGGDALRRRREARAAAEVIGARLVLENLDDTRIPEGDPTVALIERLIAETSATILYTHSTNDVHQDHRNTHAATMVAARRVPYILCFQSPSTTINYRPTRFVDIERTLEDKLSAIRAFGSQNHRDYLDEEMLRATARYWARFAGALQAEPFEVMRDRRVAEATRSHEARGLAVARRQQMAG
jgi:LmbE family N-acetylglucosaminyl deacetylase/CheY-like chemotaxis protein